MVESLSARPPTPPRTTSHITIDENQSASPLTAQTPKDTPFKSLLSGPDTSSRSSKRVNFSPWPKYIKPPAFTSNQQSASDSKITPSTDLKPAKSILKATQSPLPAWSPNVDTFTAESLAMLLESVIQQLAGESITSRLDAYMQFFGALRTYDGLPAGQEIAEKLNLITDFIQRDANRDLTNAEPHNTNLTNQALKLSTVFVWHSQISKKLSDEFKIFLVDQSITSLREAKAPKSVLMHYMSIMSEQNFGPKVMTNARVTRLLTVLQEVHKNVSGNAILSRRLDIYQRLLGQAKHILLPQAHLWIEHLIFGLLHNFKDTREKAIVFGFQLAVEAGPNPTLSKSVQEVFERSIENDQKLVDEIRERMTRMMSTTENDTESGVHVPQIWSIVILLLRTKGWNLEKWKHYKEWLLVLQKCFNCSDPTIKAQAILGWNRFVSVVGPNESTSLSLLKMLGKPVLSQFDRRKSDKSGSSPPSQLALNSYYNLLYYTFRPSASYQHLDFIWEEYVVTLSSGIFSSVPTLSDCLSRIVSNLLWSNQAKIWTDGRINDPNKMDADELPSADSKWVRSRISPVLKVFENLFKSSGWVDNAPETSNVTLAWSSLSSALSLASSKEITPSKESMQAVIGIVDLLHRLWVAGPSALNASSTDIFFQRFQCLCTIMIPSIGGIAFTEKPIFATTDQAFATASTPAHRHPQPRRNIDSPILHLLRSISSTDGSLSPTTSYKNLVGGIIEAACAGKISRGSRLELLQQCAKLSTVQANASPPAAPLSEVVWASTAQAASDALQTFPMESTRERDGTVSRDYEHVIEILFSGLVFPPAFGNWSGLLESFVRVVRTEKGAPAIAKMILEPMAERIMDIPVQDAYLPSTSLFGHSLSIPFLQGTGLRIDHGGIQSPEHAIFPHKFIESISRTLRDSYNVFSASECQDLAEFIDALASFLGSGVPQFQRQVLEGLQPTLGIWLKDEASNMSMDEGADGRIKTACCALVSATLNVLQTSVAHDLPSSETFEEVLRAGLESSHIPIVKRFVDLWASTFGSQNSSTYSLSLLQTVQTAESRLQTAALLLQNGEQDVEMPSPPIVQNAADDSINQLHYLAQPSHGSQSSLVVQTEAHIVKEAEQMTEPQLPENSQSKTASGGIENNVSASRKRRNRREMFSMIESIQSSSPAKTPRKSGFNTPPHLRRLQSGESASDPPLTPILVPTEHEDGFIGSSPTPGTRDPTPATASVAPVLMPQEISTSQATDPPSSPPQIHSQSPSPQKGRGISRSARRRAARARKALSGNPGIQSTVNSPATSRLAGENNALSTVGHDQSYENDKENTDSTPRANETTPSRRLRSTSGKEPTTAQELALVGSLDSPNRTPVPKSRNGNLRSTSSSRKRGRDPKPTQEPAQQVVEIPPETQSESVMDSSEETETQIASQLGQDLELAVDMDDRVQVERRAMVEESLLRKRKRDDEHETTQSPSTRNDRRRSTRLSTVKDINNLEASEPDASRSQSPAIAHLDRSLSPVKSQSPTATRRSARNLQRSESTNVLPDSLPATQGSPAPLITKDDEIPRPSKRSRKSTRRADQSFSSAVEEAQSPRDTRSRVTRSQQQAIDSQPQSQPESPNPASANKIESNHIPPQNIDLDIVPESLVVDELAEQSIPPVSTEATDSQISKSELPHNPDSVEPEIKMDLDLEVDMVAEQQPSGDIDEQATSLATASTQTQEQISQSQSNVSETGIIQSLKHLLGDMQLATLGPQALREVDDLLFNIRVEAHDASRRHNTSA